MQLLERHLEVDDVARADAMVRVDDGDDVLVGRADVEQLLVAEVFDDVGTRAGTSPPRQSTSPISRCSGRKPATTRWPPLSWLRARGGTGIDQSPGPLSCPSVTSASTKFIAGLPMNPATNRFAGWSYSCWGVPTCISRPSLITAMRDPIVIASTWSCVT